MVVLLVKMTISSHKLDLRMILVMFVFGTKSMTFCTQSTCFIKARGVELDTLTLHVTKMASDGSCA